MRPRPTAWAILVIAGAAFAGCTIPRDRPAGDGEHPRGWTDPESSSFHGSYLRRTGDHLEECSACHGRDYAGGPVGVGCNSCHQEGVERCGTCHGSGSGLLPSSGAHAAHAGFCGECHALPQDLRAPGHINGTADVAFSGLAVAFGATPAWDAATARCSDAYCHGGESRSWQAPAGAAPCDGCHGNPPASHARFRRVAGPSSCATCHPAPPDPRHVDGTLDLEPRIACDTCHGHGPLGAPAPALDGSADPFSRGAGAHRRHLDETLDDRIGRVVPCGSCHPVPASVTAPGHLDVSAPADVVLTHGGSYDSVTGSCVVGCHWDRTPGPAWTDASGAARACDGCHGFPPATMRDGTPHTPAPPELSACVACHTFTPATHVDGHVDLVP